MGQKKEEAELIADYLLGVMPNANSRRLYLMAVDKLGANLNEKETRIWNISIQHPSLLPYIDAGLALTDKLNPIRKRIYIMFAILETEKELSDKFLYKREPFWLIRCVFYVNRAIFRSVVGFLLLRVI